MDPLTIYAFLKRHPNEGFCDDCIAQSTGADPGLTVAIASTLSLFPAEFTRTEMVCPQRCGDREKAITTAT